MLFTVASNKGGVGKTTTAIHIAAYLQTLAPTLLVDNDPNRSATGWASRSENALPFRVVDVNQSLKVGRDYEHVVFDTKARPDREELKTLAEGCDWMIIPTTPDAMSIEALMGTVDMLRVIGFSQYKILLTIIPPYPERDGDDARAMLAEGGIRCFRPASARPRCSNKRPFAAWWSARSRGRERLYAGTITPRPVRSCCHDR